MQKGNSTNDSIHEFKDREITNFGRRNSRKLDGLIKEANAEIAER